MEDDEAQSPGVLRRGQYDTWRMRRGERAESRQPLPPSMNAPAAPATDPYAWLDALPACVSLWDRSLRNLYANAEHRRWFGDRVDQLRGQGLGWLIGEAALAAHRHHYEAALAGREVAYEASMASVVGPLQMQVRLQPYRPGGTTVQGVLALVTDVSAHHAAQRGLRAQREKLRLQYERSPATMLWFDRAGRVLAITDRAVAVFDRPREAIVERALFDFFTEESRRRALALGLPALFRDGQLDRWAFELRRRDGTLSRVLLSARVEPAGDAALQAVATLDDVTGEVTQAAELRREHAQRLAVERHAAELDQLLRERDAMLNVLAHEVRQPLNNASAALQSAAALLAEKGEAEASVRLERAQAVLGEVLAGVDNTLAAASLLAAGEAAMADADIDTLLAVALGDLPAAQRARVQVQRLTATRTAVLDMGLTRLALRNLLGNALAWSPPGAPVCVRLSDSDDPLALLVDVVDQGPGIAPDLLPRVFERGVRGGPRGGHGLGLFIVQRALALQGGRARVLETGPGGTVMRLELRQAG